MTSTVSALALTSISPPGGAGLSQDSAAATPYPPLRDRAIACGLRKGAAKPSSVALRPSPGRGLLLCEGLGVDHNQRGSIVFIFSYGCTIHVETLFSLAFHRCCVCAFVQNGENGCIKSIVKPQIGTSKLVLLRVLHSIVPTISPSSSARSMFRVCSTTRPVGLQETDPAVRPLGPRSRYARARALAPLARDTASPTSQ